jgi:hypothetical protein
MPGPDSIILELSTAEIVGCYNKLSKTEVKKFKDRKTAELRLHGLAIANTSKFIQAMKSVKVDPSIIAKYEAALAAEAKKLQEKTDREQAKAADREKAKAAAQAAKQEASDAKMGSLEAAGVRSDDPDFANAAKLLLEAQSKMKGSELEAAGKTRACERKPQRGLPAELTSQSRAAAVLWFVRSIIKQRKVANEEEVATSHEVSLAAKVAVDIAIKELDTLKRLGCVDIEDDTVTATDPFYYVTLTDKGREFPLGEAKPDLKNIKDVKSKREPKAPREPRVPGAPRSPRSNFAGKCIYKLVKDNPRREGSIGYASFNLIVDGMTYEDYIKAGGRATDAKWDAEHGFIELR